MSPTKAEIQEYFDRVSRTRERMARIEERQERRLALMTKPFGTLMGRLFWVWLVLLVTLAGASLLPSLAMAFLAAALVAVPLIVVLIVIRLL